MERRIGSTHIIWSGGEPADFELKLEVKLEGDIHSGDRLPESGGREAERLGRLWRAKGLPASAAA